MDFRKKADTYFPREKETEENKWQTRPLQCRLRVLHQTCQQNDI